VRTLLSKTRNPFFAHADAAYYLAERDGSVVGRIAGVSNRLHNETHDDDVGFFGLFECVEDQAVADALLAAASGYCRARGHRSMRGPASFSTNDECGLLIDAFDLPATMMMAYGMPYYPRLVERAGFVKAKDLWAYQLGLEKDGAPLQIPERLTRAARVISKRNSLRIRPANIAGDFAGEVERMKAVYNRAWERNWGFVPFTSDEIDHVAQQFRLVVVPDLMPFVEKDGQTIAFGLAMPDINSLLGDNRDGRLWPAALNLLYRIKTKRVRRGRIIALGIVPEYQGKGIDAVLYHWLWTHCVARGIVWGEAGWILEDNGPMNAGLLKMGFERYKTYRLYDRAIASGDSPR
jgi:GNAT superfamily N-acetyltransferase